MIYLDNAATTHYKPQCVIDAAVRAMNNSFNPNRSFNAEALSLQKQILDTRNSVHALFNNDSEMNVAFSLNCTSALNLAIFGSAKRGHISSDITQHNSVLRPLMQLQQMKLCTVTLVQPNEDGL